VLTEWRADPMPAYAVTANRVLPAKTNVFLAFLAQTLQAYN